MDSAANAASIPGPFCRLAEVLLEQNPCWGFVFRVRSTGDRRVHVDLTLKTEPRHLDFAPKVVRPAGKTVPGSTQHSRPSPLIKVTKIKINSTSNTKYNNNTPQAHPHTPRNTQEQPQHQIHTQSPFATTINRIDREPGTPGWGPLGGEPQCAVSPRFLYIFCVLVHTP